MPSVEKAGDGVAHSFNCTHCMADLCLADALVFKVQRSRLKNAKIAKMSKSCLTHPIPTHTVKFTSSRPTDHNVSIPGAGKLAAPCTARFLVFSLISF